MNKIIVLLGESGCGKTTIARELVDRYGYKSVVSHTTRNPRQGEVNGVDYHFITNDEFDEMDLSGMFIETTNYDVNGEILKYGIAKHSISDDRVNVVILNPCGVKQIVKGFSDRIIAFKLTTSLETRIMRYMNRDKVTGDLKIALVDRIIRDLFDFKDFNIRDIVDKGYDIDCNNRKIDEIVSIIRNVANIITDNDKFLKKLVDN